VSAATVPNADMQEIIDEGLYGMASWIWKLSMASRLRSGHRL